ncbi:hypothetical protein CKO31_04885 [Thiohalocapsa halophila]|uniref:Uncharacterized protein n=1 Tax=Thiohalocapsa halophila TaxID=69359 RepID=A0ABS1CFC2_9GAMM|nr:hypothetical protein [Thiohalocapsa halophila]
MESAPHAEQAALLLARDIEARRLPLVRLLLEEVRTGEPFMDDDQALLADLLQAIARLQLLSQQGLRIAINTHELCRDAERRSLCSRARQRPRPPQPAAVSRPQKRGGIA